MTSCGFCCYYLEHCSKTNHIAIKWTKYENVYGLVASYKIWWSPNFLRLSVTCVTRTRRVEYETKRNKKTEWRSLPYKPWFNKNMLLEYFFLKCVKGRKFSEVIRKKNTTWKFMQIMWNVNWRLVGLLFWRGATLTWFVSALSKERYDSWKGFKFATRQICTAA